VAFARLDPTRARSLNPRPAEPVGCGRAQRAPQPTRRYALRESTPIRSEPCPPSQTKPRSRVHIHQYSRFWWDPQNFARKKDRLSKLISVPHMEMRQFLVFFSSLGRQQSPPASAPDRSRKPPADNSRSVDSRVLPSYSPACKRRAFVLSAGGAPSYSPACINAGFLQCMSSGRPWQPASLSL
jgi:hypothetical protein